MHVARLGRRWWTRTPPLLRRFVHALAVLMAVTTVRPASAEPGVPSGLDGLVAVALHRHPEIAALVEDADAARANTSASGRLMDPEWMLGVQALGAMPDSLDPTMAMVGVQQMFSFPGVYSASRRRAALDEQWTGGERARAEADLREALWAAVARLRASSDQMALLAGQITAAEAAVSFGRARYGAGVGSSSPLPMAGVPEATTQLATPPPVTRSGGGGGMSGMGGSGPERGASSRASGGMAAMPGTGEMSGMSKGTSTGMGGEGLSALLRLDAEIARLRAEYAALVARNVGEQARLALVVGPDAAQGVVADPRRYLGTRGTATEPPERALAATSLEIAEADLRIARAERLPTFMAGADVRIMPDGMVDGVDAQLGVRFPIWGGSAARVDAAAASTKAAFQRAAGVDRGLADAVLGAQSELAAAEARLESLSGVAAPRAHAAWEATLAVWSTGEGTVADLIAAWQLEVAVARETTDAALATELARARLSRLEGR